MFHKRVHLTVDKRIKEKLYKEEEKEKTKDR